jgi:Ser-tRNA(Ala) deacylase AlaX
MLILLSLKNTKKIRKIKIYKKKREKKGKRKVEGPVWKPSNTSPINTMLQ